MTLPAAVLTRFSWRVSVSGAGPSVDDEALTRRLPVGFVVVVLVLAADVLGMAWYFGVRRHARRRQAEQPWEEVTLEALTIETPAAAF